MFRAQAKRYGFDEQKYLAALERVPRWSHEHVEAVMSFYTKLAGMISSLSLSTIKLAREVSTREKLFKDLGRSEEQFRALVQNHTDVIMRFDCHYRHLFVNAAVSQFVSIPPESFTGKTHRELGFPESQCQLWEENLKKVLSTGQPLETEFEFDGPGGKQVVNWRLFPEHGTTGQVETVLSVSRDITARKYMQKSLERERKAFQLIAESSASGGGGGSSDLCRKILSGLVSTLGFDCGTLRLYDEEKKILYPAAASGVPRDMMNTFSPQHIDDAYYLAAHVGRTREAIFAPDVKQHKILQAHGTRLDELGVHSIISWPIIDSRQALLGVIQLMAFNAKEIPGNDRDFFEAVAGMFSIALERALALEALKSSHEKLAATLNALPDAMFEVDMEGIFREDRSHTSEDLYVPPEAFIGKSLEDVLPAPVSPLVREALRDAEMKGSHRGTVYCLEMPAGPRWYELSVACKGAPGTPEMRFIALVRNITERKEAEEKITSLLAEKELLLREVHHRIKNNMNTMMNLLTLQSATLHDPAAVTALKEARSRLSSMGLLYDKLYRSENVREMAISDYLPPLINEIVGTFPSRGMVEIKMDIGDFVLGVKVLSSLGLMVNELLTNAMKYAFSGRRSGVITISASSGDNRATFMVEDNGVGIPESIAFETSTGFGLQLVALLTKQLKGTIRLERGQGTRFILEFNV